MLNNIFRMNPVFDITPIEELEDKYRRKFAHIVRNDNIRGLLHAPSEARVTVKALNQDMIDFLGSFREPGRISDFCAEYSAENREEVKKLVIRLVLDSVLEIQVGNEFISGVDAVNTLLHAGQKSLETEIGEGRNQIQALSTESLEYVLKLESLEPMEISSFLYNFNRLPFCLESRKRLHDEKAVMEFLGLTDDNTWDGMGSSIKPKPQERDSSGEIRMYDQVWRYWYLSGEKTSTEDLNYKIYVSPTLDDLPEVFAVVREEVIGSGAYSMKIGRRASELFRSDKLIIYFNRFEPSMEFALKLAEELGQFSSQGVPFSHQVSEETSIVSMGVDPPSKFGEKNSWRRYITDNLALAIQSARRSESGDIHKYIHTHMRMVGIDSTRWRPVRDDWKIEFELEGKAD
ncbi:MAG: hypothetical protein GF417_01310 [Candidatus Latescibacteria bacterium]|nr:hypothetical protein [bacterium]MBD3423064.1 hypothetical protein [Candidatus Latescibacterota bacterium]